jgi:hypothetical protein
VAVTITDSMIYILTQKLKIATNNKKYNNFNEQEKQEKFTSFISSLIIII